VESAAIEAFAEVFERQPFHQPVAVSATSHR